MPGGSGLWAPIAAAAGETLPPPPRAPPAQQEPGPWSSAPSAIGPFLPFVFKQGTCHMGLVYLQLLQVMSRATSLFNALKGIF